MVMRSKTRLKKGQSIIETVVGVVVLTPIVLLAVDASMILTSNRANQELAHNAARAAANKTKESDAQESANKAVDSFEKTTVVKSVTLTQFEFNTTTKLVTLTTTMEITVPVPFPGVQTVNLHAHWTEPIVALPASI